MANCSFLNATEARNIARNNTLIWTEICEVQEAILAAIDANTYSTIVAGGTPFTTLQEITAAVLVDGGTGYSIEVATATIDANGTGGTGATVDPVVSGQTVTSFENLVGGSGYAPVSATAVVGDLYDLIDAQTEADYPGTGAPDGDFTAGQDYRVGEIISLSEGSTSTVGAIAALAAVTTIGQDELDYAVFVGGDGVGGTAYQVGTTITMSDGSVILVDTVDVNGDVVTFDVTSASTSSFPVSSTLSQVSAQSTGLGFTLTTAVANEISVGTVTTFTVGSPGVTPFNWPGNVTQASTDGIGRGFVLLPQLNNLLVVSAGVGGVLTPVVTNGIVTNIVINSPGTGYLSGAPVSIVHPSGSGASALIGVVGGGGEIQSVTIVNGGTGYETVNALVTITHSTGQDFAGTVQVTAGVVTGISIQDGGVLYGNLFPTIVVNDASGTGANINVTGLGDGTLFAVDEIASIQLTDGGSGYSQTPSLTYFNSDGTQHSITSEDITLTVETNTYGTDPQEYYAVLSGQATDAVIADQIQYVLDYFDALGYNIRAQVNPATGDTMQWQLIW